MKLVRSKYRHFIHYALIACALLIQLSVLVFFYNEYFNERKLSDIENQIKESKGLRTMIQSSRQELFNAQTHLQNYVQTKSKKELQAYFHSLEVSRFNLDSIDALSAKGGYFQNRFGFDEGKSDLRAFDLLIDSIYKASEKLDLDEKEFEIKDIAIDKTPKIEKLNIEVTHSKDTLSRKKFFPRIKDAIKGEVEVKRDTVFVSTTYEQGVDTEKIQESIDSTLTVVQNHYKTELGKYQDYLSGIDEQNKQFFRVYEGLINSANGLMKIYDGTIDDFQSDLESQFYLQNSLNEKIRKRSIMGLLIFTSLMLLVLIFYTRASFRMEKELQEANLRVNQHLKFKNRILGMLSHETLSPLKIMNIFIGRIQNKNTDPNVDSYLKTMKFTNNSLLLQANQILEYAKNEQRELHLENKEFLLLEEIEKISQAFQAFIESKGNRFESNIDIPSDVKVFSDAPKIYQLFTNILGNANKFTEQGSIEMNVSQTPINATALLLNVSVQDTGVGITENDLKHIFDAYYQGVLSSEIENLGAGLGLNLCYELVQLLGGKLKVESKLGSGTWVAFEIPLQIVKSRKE